MSDHDVYRKLMERAATAPLRTGFDRLLDAHLRTSRGLNPSRGPRIQALKDAVEYAHATGGGLDYIEQLRQMQAEAEVEAVEAGEMQLNQTSLPVRAGVEAIQNRLRSKAREQMRSRLRMWMRRGRNGKQHAVYRRQS